MTMNVQRNLLILLFFLSGVCNLVYEIVWARMLNLVFGVTVFAVSAVLASFMLGLATGAVVFGRVVDSTESRVGLFSVLHVGIFVSTIAILFVFPFFQDLYLFVNRVLHPDFYLMRIILFFLSLLLLIIPTAFMGATFPVATEILGLRHNDLGKTIGVLYSANTL
jgi:spermidine synthase